MSANGIAHLETKELRQKAKLDLAAEKRAATGRPSTVDLTELPTQYSDNDILDNPNADGLLQGRPWVNAPAFTFFEAIDDTDAIAVTKYVSGNKIYAYSSSYDVPGFQPARVVVNDIEIVDTTSRGHTLAVLDTYGDTVSITNYDTYGSGAAITALASALGAVASGNIVVLVSYDACAFNSACRSALTSGYGNTNSNTWTARRYDHIFIGVKS